MLTIKGEIMHRDIAMVEKIHKSLVNGNRRQMVSQIDEYGLYDFWTDYRDYLWPLYKEKAIIDYFSDAVISYHRIKSR